MEAPVVEFTGDPLTDTERKVLAIIRHMSRFGAPVRMVQVSERMWQLHGRYAVTKPLASLVSKGLLSKPRRGYYLPIEEASA